MDGEAAGGCGTLLELVLELLLLELGCRRGSTGVAGGAINWFCRRRSASSCCRSNCSRPRTTPVASGCVNGLTGRGS